MFWNKVIWEDRTFPEEVVLEKTTGIQTEGRLVSYGSGRRGIGGPRGPHEFPYLVVQGSHEWFTCQIFTDLIFRIKIKRRETYTLTNFENYYIMVFSFLLLFDFVVMTIEKFFFVCLVVCF